jgi:NADH-quinone oxidoreductase subunit C
MFSFLKDFIFIFLISNSRQLSYYYVQQFTLHVSIVAFKFIIKFFKRSSFYVGNLLLDIAVCDRKDATNRFIVTYVFGSVAFTTRFYIRLLADNFLFLTSIVDLFKSALWLEREVYDMFGLFFYGNADLRRILTDYGFNGFPLQKDFPLVGFVEKQFSLADNIIITRPVTFVQEFRFVD